MTFHEKEPYLDIGNRRVHLLVSGEEYKKEDARKILLEEDLDDALLSHIVDPSWKRDFI